MHAQKPAAVPAAIVRVTEDWYARKATVEQLEYGVREIPKWLAQAVWELPEGEMMHYQMAVSGMNYDLAKARGDERLRQEGIHR